MRPLRSRPAAAAAGSLIAALALAGCAVTDADSAEEPEESDADPPTSLTIVTGGTSGIYYPIGGALGQIIDAHLDGMSATVEATGGSVENLGLLGSGSAQLALTQGDAADQAFNGLADFEGGAVRTNTIAVLYPNVYHVVTLDPTRDSLGLECFSDLQGTRYSVGDVGSGNEVTTNQVFDSLGLDVTSDIERSQLGFADTATALTAGDLDAGAWVVGQGHEAFRDLAATADIALVPMCEDEVARVTEGYGGYTAHTIPAGTYPGVDEDVPTIAVWNALVVPEDFDEQQAYELTKAIFDHVDTITDVYAPAEEFLTPDNASNAPVPLHPGALRYYEEVGADLPD